jgi:hypothetical protein
VVDAKTTNDNLQQFSYAISTLLYMKFSLLNRKIPNENTSRYVFYLGYQKKPWFVQAGSAQTGVATQLPDSFLLLSSITRENTPQHVKAIKCCSLGSCKKKLLHSNRVQLRFSCAKT